MKDAGHRNKKFVEESLAWLHTASMEESLAFYEAMYCMDGCDDWTIAEIGKGDRFFLGVHIIGRVDLVNEWLYARCREVEANTDGYLDLWFREGYKSTVITFLGVIQEILKDPEITIGIFSHVRTLAKKFLFQIKQELEGNDRLKRLYQKTLFENPSKESPKWTEEAITVKRVHNPKECTVECSGLVDGMPTGAHYKLRVYDDVVVPASISTPEQVAKTTTAFELSDNLGARGEDGKSRAWAIGTRYSYMDTYSEIIERGLMKLRIYPATHDGTPNGKPVFFSEEVWADKKLKQGPATIACQMLQNPAAGTQAMFDVKHLRYADIRPGTVNIYILCDPASSKKKGSDRTAMPVIAVDAARNKYLVDGYHHKMSLPERWTALSGLRKHWLSQPGVQGVHVGYERYGMRSDLEHFEEKMLQTKDSFDIKELAWPTEGPGSKYDRIQRLYPDFSQGKFYIPLATEGETKNQRKMREEGQPFRILKPTRRRDHEGNIYDLNENLRTEYLVYPFAVHDDLLDAISRIYDMDYQPPIVIDERNLEPEVYSDGI